MASSTSVRYPGFKMPKTWKGRMEALVHGAIDYDDAHALAAECAKVVDNRLAQQSDFRGVMWASPINQLVHAAMKNADPDSDIARMLIRCGELADEVEAEGK